MEYNIKYGSVASGAAVVALAQAKINSNIEDSSQDVFLQLLLDASVDDAERYIDSPILEREMMISFSSWDHSIELPIGPIQSIDSLKYRDVNGVEQTVDPSDYRHDTDTGYLFILIDDFPDLEENNGLPIKLNCTAGYSNDEMPASIQSAVLMRFSHKELYREDVPTSMDRAFYASLRNLKRWG